MQTTVTYRGQLLTINLPSRDSYGRGATATVLRGTVVTGAGIQYFALKVYPMFPTPVELELLNREIDVWQKFNHPRILPFIGRCELGSHQVALVSPFMKNGNMCEYLRENPSKDRLRLVIQVAEGLQYLHRNVKVVHGDIKGENVLISDDGTILLADFGLSTLVEATNNPTATHIRQRKTIRFSAPELFMDVAFNQVNQSADEVHILRSKTTFSDVFAFGMLIYQTYTDKPPWPVMHEVQVMTYIIHGVFPPRPTEGDGGSRFCNATWALCEQCWAASPENRPSITDVLVLLEGLTKIRYAPASLNPLAKEFKITLTHAPSRASPPLNALAVPFSPRSPIIPTQLTTKAFPSTLNSQAAVFMPRARPATGVTPPRAPRSLDPHAVPFVPRSTPVPAIRADEEILENPAQRSQSPAQLASICASSPSTERLHIVSPPSMLLPPPDPAGKVSPDHTVSDQATAVRASPSPTAQGIPPSARTTQPKLNYNAPAFVPRLPHAQLNRYAPVFIPRRAIPPPLLCTSLAPSPPPLVDSPRTPDLVPDLPSSAPPTPSTAHPTPTRGDSAGFNLDAKPFVPLAGQRLRRATTPVRAEDDKQETIRAMAYALIF